MNELVNNKIEKSQVLTELFSHHTYGDIVLHSEIEDAISSHRGSGQYATTISKTRKMLLENHHIAIENVRGQGYKIVNPDDFTDYALGFYKRGISTIRKGKKHLENAPVEDMSQESVEIYRRVNDRAVRLQAAMAGVSVELKTLAKKSVHPCAVLSTNDMVRNVGGQDAV